MARESSVKLLNRLSCASSRNESDPGSKAGVAFGDEHSESFEISESLKTFRNLPEEFEEITAKETLLCEVINLPLLPLPLPLPLPP